MPHIKNSIITTCLFLIACTSPEKGYLDGEESDPPQSIEEDPKDEANEYVELAEDVIDIVESIDEEIKKNRLNKDSIYEATRPEKWVIRVGDYAIDEDYLLEDYLEIRDFGEVMTFMNSNGNYFLFFEEIGDELELIEKLPEYQTKMGEIKRALEVVDLNANCSQKENLVMISPITIGKRKNKHKIKCYACEK